MTISTLEKALIEWSNNNKYIVLDRIWKSNSVFDKQIGYALGSPPDTLSMIRAGGDIEKAKEMDMDMELMEDFTRDIWTPTGLVNYQCFFTAGEKLPTEENYKEFLENGEEPCENLFFYHGPKIKNWQSKEIPRTYRTANAIVKIYLSVVGGEERLDQEGGSEAIEILYYHERLKDRKDALSQIMFQMRELELYEYREDREKRPKPPFDITTSTRQDMDHFSMPNNINTYKIILDHWAKAINNTEN